MKKLTLGLTVLFSGFAVTSFAALPAGPSKCKVVFLLTAEALRLDLRDCIGGQHFPSLITF